MRGFQPRAVFAVGDVTGHLVLIALGVFFLVAHVRFHAFMPATIDSVNLSLGVRNFNIAEHQPHPPGYPIVIALGKLIRVGLEPISRGEATADAVRALSFLSAAFGAIALVPLVQFFRRLEMDDQRAVAATMLTVTCPLFWFTAARPMSDIPGLVAGLSAQALLVTAFRRYRKLESGTISPRERVAEPGDGAHHRTGLPLALGALIAGVSIGFRSQNVWLTVPLLIWTLASCRASWRVITRAIAAFGLGVLLWAIPLVFASGGFADYLAVLRAQGFEDLKDADMLVTHPSMGRLAVGLIHTFAYPWANTAIAAAIIGASLLGATTMVIRSSVGALLLLVAALPYGMFHLLFQESTSTRYALPLVPTVAYFTVCGLQMLAGRAMVWLTAALSVACVFLAFPPLLASARTASPVYQALDDMRDETAGGNAARVLATHHAVARMLRGQQLPLRTLSSVPKREWLSLMRHWQEAPDTPVWFLGEADRNDLALIDPHSRRLVRSYAWSFQRKFLMSRVPSGGLNWYEMDPPGWMAAEGWSLSPEAAGVAMQDSKRPGNEPITALVRRRPDAAVLMVGGGNVSGLKGPTARFELSIGGKQIDAWSVGTGQTFFRMLQLPAGTLEGPAGYVPFQIRAQPIGGPAESLSATIEQFDIQSASSIVYGFDSGWYPQEYDGAAPRPWRWSGPRANVRIHHAGRNLTLRVIGEVPLGYLQTTPSIVVRAGSRHLARFVPGTTNLDLRVEVSSDALEQSDNVLTIDVDQTFIADEIIHNGDHRRLALRVYQLELRDASDPN